MESEPDESQRPNRPSRPSLFHGSSRSLNRMQVSGVLILMLFLLYAWGYVEYRITHTQKSKSDQSSSLIFPRGNQFMYVIFKPLVIVDGALTGIHIVMGEREKGD